MPAPQVDEKLSDLRITYKTKCRSDRDWVGISYVGHRFEGTCQEACEVGGRWRRKGQAQLKTPPNSAIQQLRVIGGRDDDDTAGKAVDLKQQAGNDPFDFACLVNVASLLAHHIELIKEEHAGYGAHIVEQPTQALCCLSEEAADQLFIPHGQQGKSERFGDCFGKRGLAVARRARQKQTMARLNAVRPQKIGSVMLLD